jgi:hypothetical protein
MKAPWKNGSDLTLIKISTLSAEKAMTIQKMRSLRNGLQSVARMPQRKASSAV